MITWPPISREVMDWLAELGIKDLRINRAAMHQALDSRKDLSPEDIKFFHERITEW